ILVKVAIWLIERAADVRLRAASFIRVSQTGVVAPDAAISIRRLVEEIAQRAGREPLLKTELDAVVVPYSLREERLTRLQSDRRAVQLPEARIQNTEPGIADDVDFALLGIQDADVFNWILEALARVARRSHQVRAKLVLGRDGEFARARRLDVRVNTLEFTLG